MKDTKSETLMDQDWEQRTLCVDESCIGVIGPDGCCKECGLPFTNRSAGENKPASSDEIVIETSGEDPENEIEGYPTDEEWEQRTLCVDESCIGVIGPDGRCKECGLPFHP